MDQICLVMPVLPGRSEGARDFFREIEESRKDEFDRCEQRIGITKEVWHLAAIPGGDALVVHIESQDFANALKLFSESQDEFDLWFKRRLADATGVDLNHPPAELLYGYAAAMAAA